MRITDNMRFNTAISNLFITQSQYSDILEKVASQKKVNRASDDPVAATRIIDIRQGKAANEQYQKNIDSCNSWVSATESKLSSAYDLLVNAQEIAVGQSTGTATATTRQIAVLQVQSLIDEMASLANAKLGDRYLFSGSQRITPPFSAVLSAATIEPAKKAADNTFAGTVTSSGTYTGTVNKTYAVKIIKDGTLGVSTYQFSTDGGRTWNGPDLDFGTISTVAEGSGTTAQALKGSIANSAGGSPIAATTVWNTITDANVQVGTTFTITGKKHDGTAVSGSYTITDAAAGTVNDLLSQIKTTFGATVTATIDAAGKITVTDTTAGDSQLEMNLVGSLPMPIGGVVGPVDLDGVKLTFDDLGGTKAFGKNDIFYVNAIAPGYYKGDSEELSMTINRGTNLTYNTSGAEAFTAAGSNGIDIFQTLNDLKDALNSNNVQGISGQLDNLKNAQSQVNLNQSRCGTKANHIEVVTNSLADFDKNLNDLLSVVQDADLADLSTRLSMKELALKASYAMAAKIGNTTILDFIK